MGKIILFILVCFLIYHIVKFVRKEMRESEEGVDDDLPTVDEVESEFQRKLKEISEEKSKSMRRHEARLKHDKEEVKSAEKIKQKLTNN